MSAPLCLVTGANTGIGLEVARGLARTGAVVVLACRDAAKAEAARRSIAAETGAAPPELLLVDLASQTSIRAAAREFAAKHPELEVLVNNAGVVSPTRQLGPDGIELTFATNVLGYFLLTAELLHTLRAAKAARIVNVASSMAHGLELADVEFKRRRYDPSQAYAQSKQANRMLTWALARRLAGSPVTANAMAPGACSTKLLHALYPGFGGKTAAQGADTVVWLATSPEVAGKSGRFWENRREAKCRFRDDAAEEALWSLCERMTAARAAPRS